MKKLTILLLIFQSVQGISQVNYLNYSNLMLFEPSSIESNRIEICDYFISTYDEQANDLQSEIDNDMRHKDRDMIETEIQLLTDYSNLWKEVKEEHPFPTLLNVVNDLECYQISGKDKNYTSSEIALRENEFWKNDQPETVEVKIQIEKTPGDAEWVSVDRYKEKGSNETERIACYKQEKAFQFQINNETVSTERLPSNFNLDEEKEFVIFQMELTPYQYKLISLNDGERIEMESWKEVGCE